MLALLEVADKMPHPPLAAAVIVLVGVAILGRLLAAGARSRWMVVVPLLLVSAGVWLDVLPVLLTDGPGGAYASLRTELGLGYLWALLAVGALPAASAVALGNPGRAPNPPRREP